MNADPKLKRISYCPHCGNNTPQIASQVHETSDFEFTDEGLRVPLTGMTYYFAICGTCDQALVYRFDEYRDQVDPDHYEFECSQLLWPDYKTLPESVPETVRDCYFEGLRVKAKSPTSFAINIRRALEALCDDRGAAKGPLQKRLKSLAAKNDIPGSLAEMTEVIRTLGNAGAHDFRARLLSSDAAAIDDFFKVVIEYVYVAPDKVDRFRSRLATFGKPSEPTESKTPHEDDSPAPDAPSRVH